MKRLFVALLACCLFIPSSVVAEETHAEVQKEPKVKALGAVLLDYRTGRVLWGKNEHTPMAMASTTKIMTALIALESGKLDETVTISKRAALTPPVKMGLSTGENVVIHDLMYALMLESQNDAAVAIAEGIGGSVEEFCKRMTERAREIGALNTVFETPNGLDHGDHHSTAYDMAVITRYALSNPDFVDLINTKTKTFKSDRRSYSFVNKNRLLSEYDGANGVKTGFTGKAGHCFVGAARRGDMELISVVLASGWGNAGKQGKWSDTKTLLNYGFENFKYAQIIQTGQPAGCIAVERSRTPQVSYVYGDNLILPMREGEINNVQVRVSIPEAITAPVKPGDVVGEAYVTLNGQICRTIPLTAITGAERHDFKTTVEKVLSCFFSEMSGSDVLILLPF
jgi:D-alanyl-D-alanine carboxypeptidase (penicillin-binding protein 5/6)